MTSNPFSLRTRGSAGTGDPSLPGIIRILAVAALGLSGCLTQEETSKPPVSEKAFLFSVTTDYKTGSYSAFGIDSAFIRNSIEPIHSDAVVRYLGGNDIFVINRLGRDNLQIVDRHNLRTVLQFRFDALSNPQDIALKDSLLYVSFLGKNKIGVYNESEGALKGEIDLSAYADSSDQLAEAADLLFVGSDLYAITENLDTKTPNWNPLTAHLLKIDIAARKVAKSLELPFGNPAGMTYDSASGKLYVPCRGSYTDTDFTVKKDGGIVGIDLARFAVADTLAREADLGGNVNRAQLYDGRLIMDLGTDLAEKVVAISLHDGTAKDIVQLDPYTVGDLAVDAATATLFIGDRKKGAASLRIFDLATFSEKAGSKVDLGMPPGSMAVIR